MNQQELEKKADEYKDQKNVRSINVSNFTHGQGLYHAYIEGYKQCEKDYEEWRQESLNKDQDY